MRTLLVMRHAKSDWDSGAGSDHDRPLAGRGVRSARLMGRLLTGLDVAPGYVLSSTAIRARSTAALAAEAGGWDAPVVLEPGFYGGSVDSVLGLAAGAPPVDRLMVVGHEPVWSALVARLTGTRVTIKTATVAVIAVDGDGWASLPETTGGLVALHHPRDYFGSEWDSD